jgi:hypothetical protein
MLVRPALSRIVPSERHRDAIVTLALNREQELPHPGSEHAPACCGTGDLRDGRARSRLARSTRGASIYDPRVGKFRRAGLVVLLALLLAVAGCNGSDDDSSPVVKYGTDLTIARDQTRFYHGDVLSKVQKCADGRRVLLFEQRPGRDRELGATQSELEEPGTTPWGFVVPRSKGLQRGDRIYAKAIREEGSGYVCRPARSKILLHLITAD